MPGALDPLYVAARRTLLDALEAVLEQLDAVVLVGAQAVYMPESLGGPGRRAARIPPHDKRAARKVAGLEGTLVDRDIRRIGALTPEDGREFDVSVAGPSGLLVAKVFKIVDRATDPDRRTDKDALDVFRLLRAVPTEELVRRLRILATEERSRAVTAQALDQLPALFGRPAAIGCVMAARAAAPFEAEETTAASATLLAQDLLNALREDGES